MARLHKKNWAQEQVANSEILLQILNDVYRAPITRNFRYAISEDLRKFTLEMKRLEHIRREICAQPETWKPDTFKRTVPWPTLKAQQTTLRSLHHEGEMLIRGMNEFLYRFVTRPQLLSNGYSPLKVRKVFESSEERMLGCAVECVLEYLRLGILDRLRSCEEDGCRRWFLAASAHQRYCCDSCRMRRVSKGEEFKAKRARYMREKYRPQLKQMEERAKKLAQKRRD